MSSIADAAWLADLHRAPRTVVVVDMVESVRLIERYEEPTIRRWRSFVQTSVQEDVLPRGGRLVKSLGDGMMLEFTEPLPAVQCALALQARLAALNEPLDAEERMDARIGIHAADVIVQEEDIYGAGVNLAARVATLAGPGEIVVTPAVRDQVVDGLDAQTEDLGECYLKHLPETVRAYRLSPCDETAPKESSCMANVQDRPLVAMLVPQCDAALLPNVQLLHDRAIAGLGRMPSLRVVSRLSSAAVDDRYGTPEQIGRLLGANYLVSGRVVGTPNHFIAIFELADTQSQQVCWTRELVGNYQDLLQIDSAIIAALTSQINTAINDVELARARTQPPPTLSSFTLLLGAVNMMHRQSRNEFLRARDLLEHLADRYPRYPNPHAWLGKWFALSAAQGWAGNLKQESSQVQTYLNRALDIDPSHSLALTIQGLILGYVNADIDAAQKHYAHALEANGSEALAWLYTATANAWQGRGDAAVNAAKRALSLSPLDPLRYYFDSLAATAFLANGELAESIRLSKRSLRANRVHTSTYRMLAVAQVYVGDVTAARETVDALRVIDPNYTISDFLKRYPGRDGPNAKPYALALGEAGLPH